jgi:hypothetical protein
LFNHVADHAFRLRAEYIQRICFNFLIGRSLKRKQTHLWAITERQNDLVLLCNRRYGLCGNLDICALDIVRHRLTTLEQGISA